MIARCAIALLVCASAASPREAVPPGVAPGFVVPCAAPLQGRARGRARHHHRARGLLAPLVTACAEGAAGAAGATGGNVRRGNGGDGFEGRAHDSWALLLRHHANTEWHGVRSEYRLSNPLTLRTHHGRPGKRVRVLDADSHGTVISSLRPVRKPDVGGGGGGGGGGAGGANACGRRRRNTNCDTCGQRVRAIRRRSSLSRCGACERWTGLMAGP